MWVWTENTCIRIYTYTDIYTHTYTHACMCTQIHIQESCVLEGHFEAVTSCSQC